MNVYTSINGGSVLPISGLPDKCPYCHTTILPLALFATVKNPHLDVFFRCPHQKCNSTFIGYYTKQGTNTGTNNSTYIFSDKISQGHLVGKVFNDTVSKFSSNFVKIYNEALQAEQLNLLEICGVGYRKALEFLIKDYLIHNLPDDKVKIESRALHKCITEYVVDASVKKVASRAVWLGNDETHYVRKWEGKDLNDLKKLIDLTVHWIEMETLTKSFEDEMPG